jgi:hypothetical protein
MILIAFAVASCGGKAHPATSREPACNALLDKVGQLNGSGPPTGPNRNYRLDECEQLDQMTFACFDRATTMDGLNACDRAAAGRSEARVNLKRMADGAASYFDEESQFPDGSPPMLDVNVAPPPGTCCKGDKKCDPDPSLWTASTWQALKFSMDDPFFYSYGYRTPDGPKKGFVADAWGDLDCDGTYSTFELIGSVGADGKPVLGPIKEHLPDE